MRSTVLPSLLVVGLRPERLLTRGVGEFVKGLAQELGASQPPMRPAHLAAALGDRGDTGEFLNLSGAVVAVTLRTEGGRQTRGQASPAPGQAVKEAVIRMLGKESLQLRLEPGYHPDHHARLLGQRPLRHQGRSLD